jgi:hypothetical protein
MIIIMLRLDDLPNIKDPVKKRAVFIALLSEEIIKRGGEAPIVVGGEALEIYTQGAYTTGDIDLKTPLKITEDVLSEWNFIKRGRTWFNESLDLYVDLLGETLDEGKDAEKRTERVEIEEGAVIRVLSIEDLIIDRLNAFKWWDDKDSKMWVKVMIGIYNKIGKDIDKDYLEGRALSEGLQDVLKELFQELKI